jgi:hypothetical protein
MPSTQFSSTDLKQLRQQLDAWRRSQTQRSPIPAPVWEAAATLARTHGVSRVAQTLRLDFYRLRQRSIQAPAASGPGFVEIPWTSLTAPAATGPCTVELSDAQGGKMSVQLAGDSPVLVALAEAFWRRAR